MKNQQSVMEPKSSSSSSKLLPPLVVIFPSPGMGHLIPMIEFAKRLIKHQNLQVTFFIPTNGPPSKAQTTILTSLPSAISHTFLPPINLSDLPPTTNIVTLISLTDFRSLPSLRKALLSIINSSHRIVSIIVDLFGTDVFDVALEFNVPSYIFFPSPTMLLSFSFYLPQLDQEVQCEYRDLIEPIKIPGSIAVDGKDLLYTVQDRKDDDYKWFLYHSKRYKLANGIIENSFVDLEPESITLLQNNEGMPPVYPVGPLVKQDTTRTGVDGVEVEQCLKWLDEQPRGRVIFVNFGSCWTLSSDQINELAYGLETSEQRFLWVVRCPYQDKVTKVSNFDDNNDDPFDFLPKGFLERTKGRGLVVPNWASQAQILRHVSIGGFMSHCGWNSILESVVNGVPIIAWPLYAEQKMNAVLVSQEIKVAIRLKVGDDGLIVRQEIANVVKRLMEGVEGDKIRSKMMNLKEASSIALKKNGSSSKQIRELALKWKDVETI